MLSTTQEIDRHIFPKIRWQYKKILSAEMERACKMKWHHSSQGVQVPSSRLFAGLSRHAVPLSTGDVPWPIIPQGQEVFPGISASVVSFLNFTLYLII